MWVLGLGSPPRDGLTVEYVTTYTLLLLAITHLGGASATKETINFNILASDLGLLPGQEHPADQ